MSIPNDCWGTPLISFDQELLSDQTKATKRGQRHEDIAFHAAACATERGLFSWTFLGRINGSHWRFSGFIMIIMGFKWI